MVFTMCVFLKWILMKMEIIRGITSHWRNVGNKYNNEQECEQFSSCREKNLRKWLDTDCDGSFFQAMISIAQFELLTATTLNYSQLHPSHGNSTEVLKVLASVMFLYTNFNWNLNSAFYIYILILWRVFLTRPWHIGR